MTELSHVVIVIYIKEYKLYVCVGIIYHTVSPVKSPKQHKSSHWGPSHP